MQSNLLDLMENSSSSGKTSPESSQTKETLLGPSWGEWSEQWMPYHRQTGEAGPVRAWSRGHGHGQHGLFLMPNGSEWRKDAAACSLSSTLEGRSIPQRFFLSETACAGILRRAEKRGKKFPVVLEAALQAVIGMEPGSTQA